MRLLTISNTTIENPANGQKRWRIKKQNSLAKNSKAPKQNRVIECLHNSLQIAAAGQQCQTRKPLSRRPRKKTGIRDFVFVDLSPVKSLDDSSEEDEKSSSISPTITPDTTVLDNQELNTPSNYELSASNDSFQSLQSDDESIFSSLEDSSMMSKSSTFGNESCMQEYNQIDTLPAGNNHTMLGLGLLNMDISSNAGHWMSESADMYYQEGVNFEQSVAYHSHINPFPDNTQSSIEPQYENLKRSNTVPELPTQSKKSTHKRAKSTSEALKKKSSSSLQFRAYKTPLAKDKKEDLSHKRTISEPLLASPREADFFDFIDFNSQIPLALNGDELSNRANLVMSESSSFTPNTDYSETEDYTSDFLKCSNMDAFLIGGCGSNEVMGHNQFDFDFNSYVSY